MRIGVIGTSQIAHDSMQAALNTTFFNVEVVYSRHIETAKQFGKAYNVTKYETNLESFVKRDDIDIVYIASPNTFHFTQAYQALKHKKHVFIEKPAVVTTKQWQILNELATANNVQLFEAIRHAYEPNFQYMCEYLTQYKIDGATLQFGQYSSRMGQLLKGEIPNIFNPKMSAGVLMDLGVYVLHSALSWFGVPNQAQYFPIKHTNGIDLQGDIVLQYDKFNVVAHISKRTTTIAQSEIYCGDKTIVLNSADHIKDVRVYYKNDDTPLQIVTEYPNNRMQSQWEVLKGVFQGDINSIALAKKQHAITGEVIQLMERLRRQANIKFEADEEENV